MHSSDIWCWEQTRKERHGPGYHLSTVAIINFRFDLLYSLAKRVFGLEKLIVYCKHLRLALIGREVKILLANVRKSSENIFHSSSYRHQPTNMGFWCNHVPSMNTCHSFDFLLCTKSKSYELSRICTSLLKSRASIGSLSQLSSKESHQMEWNYSNHSPRFVSNTKTLTTRVIINLKL